MSCSFKPIVLGCIGLDLSAEERDFFAEVRPFGFILFARNADHPDQVRALTRALREAVGRDDAPIFVDQEGGRVARLTPPHWPALPAMGTIGALYERDAEKGAEAMRLHASITACFLRNVGIDGNCAPVLDLAVPGTSSVMGDRTFSGDPTNVAALGRVAVETYLAHGVFPVIKHMPGHGRVKVDPHHALPFVDTDRATLAAQDFAPFSALATLAPMGMNCHVVFRALDAETPVSLSRKVHDDVLRGAIGFDGLILSDDLAMKALDLPLRDLPGRALAAGADLALYCPGLHRGPAVLEENREVCAALPPPSEAAWTRWEKAKARRSCAPQTREGEAQKLDRLKALFSA